MARIKTIAIDLTILLKEEEMERIHEQKLKDELLMQSRAHRYHLRETLEQQVTPGIGPHVIQYSHTHSLSG